MDRNLRYGAAGIISACVHVLLLWVLASRLAPETVAQASRPLTLLDLTPAPSAPSPPAQAPGKAERPEPPRPAEVDRTIANALPPPEWTLAALPASAREPPRAASPASGGAGAGASAGAGEAPYDPYAGAAPLRRAAEVGGPAGFELDKEALETIRVGVSRSLKGGHGTAEIAVRIARDGRVLEAMWLGGSASPAAQAAIRQALLGARLYRPAPVILGAGPWLVELPMLQLRV